MSLGDVFDAAVKDWQAYFAIEELGEFHATGFLMKDKNRFIRRRRHPPRSARIQEWLHSWHQDFLDV